MIRILVAGSAQIAIIALWSALLGGIIDYWFIKLLITCLPWKASICLIYLYKDLCICWGINNIRVLPHLTTLHAHVFAKFINILCKFLHFSFNTLYLISIRNLNAIHYWAILICELCQLEIMLLNCHDVIILVNQRCLLGLFKLLQQPVLIRRPLSCRPRRWSNGCSTLWTTHMLSWHSSISPLGKLLVFFNLYLSLKFELTMLTSWLHIFTLWSIDILYICTHFP